MPFPSMKKGSGQVLGVYSLGKYLCMLIQNPESVGPIKYAFMLVVSEKGNNSPVLVVTCERNEMQDEMIAAVADMFDEETRQQFAGGAQWLLCHFDKSGNHHNLGTVMSNVDAEAFKEHAFSVAREKLQVTSSPVPIKSAQPSESISPSNANSGKGMWVVGLAFIALVLVFLYPPYTQHFYMSGGGEITGHGGWQFISEIGQFNNRKVTESINIGLWIFEFVIVIGVGAFIWYFIGRK